MIDNTTPIRSSLSAKSVTRSGLGAHRQNVPVTNRLPVRVVPKDATNAAQHLILIQIETATAEHELSTERMNIYNAQTELLSKGMAIAWLKLNTYIWNLGKYMNSCMNSYVYEFIDI